MVRCHLPAVGRQDVPLILQRSPQISSGSERSVFDRATEAVTRDESSRCIHGIEGIGFAASTP